MSALINTLSRVTSMGVLSYGVSQTKKKFMNLKAIPDK